MLGRLDPRSNPWSPRITILLTTHILRKNSPILPTPSHFRGHHEPPSSRSQQDQGECQRALFDTLYSSSLYSAVTAPLAPPQRRHATMSGNDDAKPVLDNAVRREFRGSAGFRSRIR